MRDRTGRELTIGMVVDLMPEGMLSAYVVEVQDGGLADEKGHIQPGRVILSISVPLLIEPGRPAPCYIVREAPPKKTEEGETAEAATEEPKKGPRRVH